MLRNKSFFILIYLFLFNISFAMNHQQSNEIPQVVLSAPQDQHTRVPTNSQVIIITQQQIKASGAINLEQVLRGRGGVQLHDLTGDGSEVAVSLRGFGANAADNSLILVNGVPLNNPDVSVPDLNMIPLEDIKRIEIIQGSEGVLFGDQAVGGVINIITKRPVHFHAYGNVSYGSYNTQIYRAGLSKQFHHGIALSLNAKKLHTDNYRDHNADNSEQLFGQADYDYTSGFWHFDYLLNQQKLLYAGALTAAQVAANRRQAQTHTNFDNSDGQFYHLKQQQALSSHWKLTTDLSRREQDGHGFLFSPFQQQESTNRLQSKLQGLIHSALVTTGIVLGNGAYQLLGTTSASKDTQQRLALFSQANIPLPHEFSFIIGARGAGLFNKLTKTNGTLNTTNSAFVTTLGLSYKPHSWLRLFIRRAGNFRFPKADENALTPSNVQGLKTQTGVSYEMGAAMSKQRWHSKISLYQLNLKNEIAYDPTQLPSQPFGANRNLTPTTRRGMILALAYGVTRKLLVGGQYTYVDAFFNSGPFKNKQIPFVAANLWHLYGDYKFCQHVDLYAEAIYTGSVFAASDDNNVAGRVPAYTLVNVNLRVKRKHYFASFKVNNIFNKDYNAYTSFIPMSQSLFFYPAPGRNYLITIGVDLS